MAVKWNKATDTVLQQYLELSCCSNAKLYAAGVRLGLIDTRTIKKDSFHYHVSKQGWRQQVATHYKRDKFGTGVAPDLSSCRLGSSARVQFSVRLVPVSVYLWQSAEAGKDGGRKKIPVFGVLGIVQELCSGLLQSELLACGAPKKSDLSALKEDVLIDFVARAIALPALKCTAIHFPQISFNPNVKASKDVTLIAGWLGVEQSARMEGKFTDAFRSFSEKVITKAAWGQASYKIKPEVSMFQMDFPPQQETTLVNLQESCPKGWTTDRLKREIQGRLDRHNVALDTDLGEIGPILKLWIARLCYYPTNRDDERRYREALEHLIHKICYQKGRLGRTVNALQDAGIRHLQAHTYPTIK